MLRRFVLSTVIFFLCFLFFSQNVQASQLIKRKILAIYNDELDKDPFFSMIHQRAEVILNHLGLEVEYHPLSKPLPNERLMKKYKGVLVWFRRGSFVKDPKKYCEWGVEQIQNKIKFVALNNPGFFPVIKNYKVCEDFFKKMGGEFLGTADQSPLLIDIKSKDSKMVEFERKLHFAEGLKYVHIKLRDDYGKSFLKIVRTDIPNSESDVVFITPTGAYAHDSYVYYENLNLKKFHWRINPFLFFERAFGIEGIPRPDTTTINGARIYYSHIDGDGIFNVSKIDNESFSSEIIYEKILKAYPDLPVTVSIITGYLDMPEFISDRTNSLYKNIFSLPNVEPASHGHAHPYIWKKQKLGLKVPGYKYDDVGEILGSVQRVRDLIHKLNITKKVNLFLWTGDCLPNEEQVTIPNKFYLLNMNGGDSRFDFRHDSYGFLYPLGILRGQFHQVYSSFPNENVYTELWHKRFYGFRELIYSLRNTESPIRIKPINIYYHYYAGEKLASLNALKGVLDYSKKQNIHPMFASEYANIVNDFFAIKILKDSDGYQVQNQGFLRTIRFDTPNLNVDLKQSKGILGYKYFQGSLYVFLDESKNHKIVFSKQEIKQKTFFVINARSHVFNFHTVNQESVSFDLKGWKFTDLQLGGAKANTFYNIQSKFYKGKIKSNEKGEIHLKASDLELQDGYKEDRISIGSF